MHRQHQLWLTIRLRGASTTCRTVRQVVYAYATLTHSLCDDELWDCVMMSYKSDPW